MDIIGYIFDGIIVLMGIYCFTLYRSAADGARELKEELLQQKSVFIIEAQEKLKVDSKITDIIENNYADWEAVYSDSNSAYYRFTTLISIFPLLGILGTVASIIMTSLGDPEGLANISGNFMFALSSTGLGLLFAIIYKLLEGSLTAAVEENHMLFRNLSQNIKNMRYGTQNETDAA